MARKKNLKKEYEDLKTKLDAKKESFENLQREVNELEEKTDLARMRYHADLWEKSQQEEKERKEKAAKKDARPSEPASDSGGSQPVADAVVADKQPEAKQTRFANPFN